MGERGGGGGGGGGRWRFLGNQAMSQSRCARTFGFPVGKKKKEACQSPECNQEALCCNGCYDSDFPLLHSYSQADEKETQKLPQPPYSSEHVTPADSFCESHSLEWEGEEVLLCSALSVSHIISRMENVKGQTDWPLSLGKSTLHNANCASAAITFPY